MSGRTVYSLLEEAVIAYGSAPALYQPRPGKGPNKYRIHNWIEYKQMAEEVAAGLRRLGIEKGDFVGLISETRAEFYIADAGIMVNGSIAAAAYTSYPPSNLCDTFLECGAKAIFVENPDLLKALMAAAETPLDVQWILFTGEAEGAIQLKQLRQLGVGAITDDPDLLPRLKAEVSPEDHAILYMTSGATGKPKMGLVTHGAIVANVDMCPEVINLGPKDATIGFLPSAHITQRIAGQFVPLRMGVPVWFSEGLSKLPHEIRSVRPTFFVAPPRVWERIYASICTEIRKRGGVTKQMFYGALGLGLEAWRRRQQDKPLPAWYAPALKVADQLVFRKIRARFGGRLTLAVSGAAPLGKDLADFYAAIGMPIYEGYGLTEGGIVCLNPMDKPVSGSIGKALPGAKFKIADDGELLIKSPTLFSGYFNDPEATASVLQDGWLATGDIAEIDSEGYVYITGRKKEVLIASNGKNIYPAKIENLFKVEPIVNQVLLLGDRMPYIAAILTLNPSAVETIKGMEGCQSLPMEEIVEAPPVKAEMKKLIARINKQLARYEQIRKYHVLERDFTIEDGELTPTMKIRRKQVTENHKKVVNSMYMGRDAAKCDLLAK